MGVILSKQVLHLQKQNNINTKELYIFNYIAPYLIMTINEIIENENICSDRYAMAAISCIFKAFGDNISSKEYWPWGKDVQCEWTTSNGTNADIEQAQILLNRAKTKFYEENSETKINEENMNDFNNQIKSLTRRINKVATNMKRVNKSSQEVTKVSDKANEIVDSIMPK